MNNSQEDFCENYMFYNRKDNTKPGYQRFEYIRLHVPSLKEQTCFVNVLGGKETFLRLLEWWNCRPDWYYYELKKS